VSRRAWVVVVVATGAVWWAAAPADAWLAKASVVPACTELHGRLTVDFENDEPRGGRGMTVVATDQRSGKSTALGTVAPGQHVTGTIDPGLSKLASSAVVFAATWSSGPPGTDWVTVKYTGIDCSAPAPVLAEGVDGASLLGLGALAVPATLVWRRRRGRRRVAV
jgi:hypothetical protein